MALPPIPRKASSDRHEDDFYARTTVGPNVTEKVNIDSLHPPIDAPSTRGRVLRKWAYDMRDSCHSRSEDSYKASYAVEATWWKRSCSDSSMTRHDY